MSLQTPFVQCLLPRHRGLKLAATFAVCFFPPCPKFFYGDLFLERWQQTVTLDPGVKKRFPTGLTPLCCPPRSHAGAAGATVIPAPRVASRCCKNHWADAAALTWLFPLPIPFSCPCTAVGNATSAGVQSWQRGPRFLFMGETGCCIAGPKLQS